MKKVAVCFVNVPNPIDKAIEQVINLFNENVEFIADPWLADLVITNQVKDLIPFYAKDGCYVVIDHTNISSKKQPENVHMASCIEPAFMATLMELANKEFSSRAEKPEKIDVRLRIENPGAMSVLVIDDTPLYQKSAELLLSHLDLTIARGYDEAMELLKNNSYDVVLTDMEMPASKSVSDQVLGELIPYGLLLYAEAAKRGAKHVAVVTNLNHHTDPIANAFDYFCRDSIKVENATVRFMHAPMTSMDDKWVKDWKRALEKLLE